jgi:hypothetical protein
MLFSIIRQLDSLILYSCITVYNNGLWLDFNVSKLCIFLGFILSFKAEVEYVCVLLILEVKDHYYVI